MPGRRRVRQRVAGHVSLVVVVPLWLPAVCVQRIVRIHTRPRAFMGQQRRCRT